MRAAILYTTFANLTEVRDFADRLLAARLAACVNALPQMRAFYRWQGELHDDPEVACIIKTRVELKDELMAFARANHPYDTPALLWFEADDVDAAFGAWIAGETARAEAAGGAAAALRRRRPRAARPGSAPARSGA